jgi:hypothetical protein
MRFGFPAAMLQRSILRIFRPAWRHVHRKNLPNTWAIACLMTVVSDAAMQHNAIQHKS